MEDTSFSKVSPDRANPKITPKTKPARLGFFSITVVSVYPLDNILVEIVKE